ncbi:MATE efflux family protein [Xylariaceae sp. FL1019]|nr:MATE efflux family protein [Xylariaceae sp. FL1019]
MASSVPIAGSVGRNSLNFPSSFVAGSPIAHEILQSDLAECSDDEEVGNDDSDDEFSYVSSSVPVLYKNPSGVAYDYRRQSMVNDIISEPIITREELQKSRAAERSLLRDNHLLPPKHGADDKRGILHNLFSTEVRKPQYDAESPGGHLGPSEVSPLLPGVATPDVENIDAQWEAAVANNLIETTWQREAKTIASYSRSLVLTFMLQYSINITSVFTVGRLGSVELGAVSLGTMTANIFCYAFFQGLSTSLDTLCAQAYGSGRKQLVGLQLQRMIFFLWLLSIPLAVLFFFAEHILLLIIPEPDSAKLAGLYLRVVLFGIPGYAAFEGGKRFVQAQGLFVATTYVLLIAAPINVFLNWLLVWHFKLGFIGAPIAVAFTQNLMPVLLLLYVVFVDGSQCWSGMVLSTLCSDLKDPVTPGKTRRAFTNWGPMIKLAIPGMLMVVAEWLAFEILTLASSQFGPTYLAAQSILVTLTSATFMLPFPVSIAASTRIANLIGANLVEAARTSAKVAGIAGCLLGLVNLTLLATLRYQLPRLFTDEEEVISIVATVMPLCAVMQIFDGLAAVAHGLLRGIGKQSFGGYANLTAYYIIAIPLSFAAAFALDWKLIGLWLGTTVGLMLVAAVEYWYCYTSDWQISVREAEHRNTTG